MSDYLEERLNEIYRQRALKYGLQRGFMVPPHIGAYYFPRPEPNVFPPSRDKGQT